MQLKKAPIQFYRYINVHFLSVRNEFAAKGNHTISSRCVKIVHYFMVIWGFLLLVLHFHASSQSNADHCAQQTWPWFGTKPGCMFLRINCNISVESSVDYIEINSIFAALNEQTLSFIAIRNCPCIETPLRIQIFNNLVGLKIYNSTLARWDADAAFTITHHPKSCFFL